MLSQRLRTFLARPLFKPGQGSKNSRRNSTSAVHPETERTVRIQRRRQSITGILNRVRERDGLQAAPPNVQYLIGQGDRASGTGSDTLDIADKTQFILQSSHPVRYIVEREISNFTHQNRSPNPLNYYDWITVFGRSLGFRGRADEEARFRDQLHSISNAGESGMFSSDVHQTVVNIPHHIKNPKLLTHLNLGNKYAVLVGDFFAIKAIHFAERAKNNQVLLCITQGVEDFTSAPFFSNLVDPGIWIPAVPTAEASVHDWINYNVKSAGYFAGGLSAVLKVCLPHQAAGRKEGLRPFIQNLVLFLRIVLELDDFEKGRQGILSPFLLISLPAVMYQAKHPRAFAFLRNTSKKDEMGFSFDDLKQIRQDILDGDALEETLKILREYGENSKIAIRALGTDEFYLSVFDELIETLSSTTIRST